MTIPGEVVTGLVLSILRAVADVHLLVKETGREGVVGQDVRPLKAIVAWVMVVYPPTRLQGPPCQLWAARAWVPMPTSLPGLPKKPAALPALALRACCLTEWMNR